MSEVKMSYIFLEKGKHESKEMKEIILEIIDDIVEEREEAVLKIDNIDITYRIIQKQNSKRCFLEMNSKERVNRSIPVLQKIDTAFFKSNMQRYYYGIRDYDGISESFCKRLYPKYAEFERKLRSLVLFILTKAYGSQWRTETISDEQLSALQEKAHGNVSLNETLENMDLAMLEAYLFEERQIDYPSIINKKLSKEYLKELEKEQICSIIETMRPTSLWERHFEKFGSQKIWKKKILDIHMTRNKVAHQKTISIEEFKLINKKLNGINKDLTNAIEGIREENFTQYGVVDILESFSNAVEKLTKNIVQSQSFRDVIIGFSAKIREILKPMMTAYPSSVVNAKNITEKNLSSYNYGVANQQLLKNINDVSKHFSSAKVYTPNFTISKISDENLKTINDIKNIKQSKKFDDNKIE